MVAIYSDRRSVASGILVVLLLDAAFAVMGQSPDEQAPPDALMRFYATHRANLMLASYLILLAVSVFLVFICALRSALSADQAHDKLAASVGFCAGLAFVPLTIAGYAVDLVLASDGSAGNAQLFPVARSIEGALIGVSDLPLAICIAGFSIAMLATARFPRWLGAFGLLPALGLLAGSLAPLAAPLGGIGFLCFLLFLIWTLATGLMSLRDAAAVAQKSQVRAPSVAV